MNNIYKKNEKKVLLVEDDLGVAEMIRNYLEEYADKIELQVVSDAGKALENMLPIDKNKPDALILDIMMPYGSALNQLKGETDPDEIESGLRLLTFIREEERGKHSQQLWVAVITARSPVAIEARVKELGAKLYCKPFNTLQLEDDLVRALGIESKVPPILLGMENT